MICIFFAATRGDESGACYEMDDVDAGVVAVVRGGLRVVAPAGRGAQCVVHQFTRGGESGQRIAFGRSNPALRFTQNEYVKGK